MEIVKYLKIGLFFPFLLCLSSSITAKTILIGPNRVIKHIKQGIATAAEGDTLLIDNARFQEGNIRIEKSLTLIGINYPLIDATYETDAFSISASHVSIQGFKICHSGRSSVYDLAAIKVQQASHIQLLDNKLMDNFFGIIIQESKNCLIKDNIIESSGKAEQQNGNGIHAWKAEHLQIINNKIKGHRDGIYLEFVSQSLMRYNLANDNIRYGLHFMFSHDNTYESNHFKTNGAGVAVMYSKGVIMNHNLFERNWGDSAYGLLLKEITDSQIENNHFSENTAAIFMEGSNRLSVLKNTFKNNGWAIKVQASCLENTFKENNFLNNSFDIASNGSLDQNTFQHNFWDKYEGYDINKDGIGDIPFRPVSMFSMLVERYPTLMILFRSFLVSLLDKTEKIIPTITPIDLIDKSPRIKVITHD